MEFSYGVQHLQRHCTAHAGRIYIGVVGPVRTGKSTFIKRFMDMLVLPNIENEHIPAARC